MLLMLGVIAAIFVGALPDTAEARIIYFENYSNGHGYAFHVVENETMTEYQRAQYELGRFEPYIAPEFKGKIDVIFVDQSSQEYLDEVSGNSSVQFWAGDGSIANSSEEIDPAAFISKFDFEEAGRYFRQSDCIRVIRMDIVDERYKEEDSDWYMYLTVENTGKHGAYIRADFPGNASINAKNNRNRTFIDHYYLASGARVQLAFPGYSNLGEQPVEIDYCRTDNFVGNSDFRSIEEYVLTRRNVASPFIQLCNATYRVDNAEKGWNTVRLEFKATGNKTYWDYSNETFTTVSFDSFSGVEDFVIPDIDKDGINIMERDVGRFDPKLMRTVSIESICSKRPI